MLVKIKVAVAIRIKTVMAILIETQWVPVALWRLLYLILIITFLRYTLSLSIETQAAPFCVNELL